MKNKPILEVILVLHSICRVLSIINTKHNLKLECVNPQTFGAQCNKISKQENQYKGTQFIQNLIQNHLSHCYVIRIHNYNSFQLQKGFR